MNVSETKIHTKCIGCGACTSVCPLNLINVDLDEAGFCKAYVNDIEKCINCGKCLNACPALNEPDNSRKVAFYGFAKDSKDRMNGTSGGIFTSIAKNYIKNGGVVFGAVLDSDSGRVYHMSSEDCDISLMSKSKYVQSDTKGVLQRIKSLLEDNTHVLFCGTPCQVSGLLRSLGKEYGNLLTIDFICHGVPSARLFSDYLLDLKQKHKNKTLSEYDFRSKIDGWGRIRVSYCLNNKKVYVKGMLDSYNYLFEKGTSVNPACYECNYRLNHSADITLGDFWAYNRVGLSKESVKEGISLCVANTDKGVESLKNMQYLHLSQMELKFCDYAFASRKKTSDESIRFYEDYSSNGYKFVKKKYSSQLLAKSIRSKIKSMLRKL